MSELDATTEVGSETIRATARGVPNRWALVIAASIDDPARLGEALLIPKRGAEVLFGRGFTGLIRQRPGYNGRTPALADPRISRQQLRLQGTGSRLSIENLGRRGLIINGRATQQGMVRDGDLIELDSRLLFRCEERPTYLPAGVEAEFPWARPDSGGMVGEAPAMWQLRARIDFVAPRDGHVLILGRSGTGKERVARALAQGHPERPFIARNAATLPESLIDAELFGHAQNYPNAGMPERCGLVGEADGGLLFLDEIGELSERLQARLLRLLDAGEYQRLGDPTMRTTRMRMVAATNRARESLKHDLLARFRHIIEVPDLNARRSDIPLLVGHLLRHAATDDQELRRFLTESDEPNLSTELMSALMRSPLKLQVRALDHALWQSIAISPGAMLEPFPTLDVAPVEDDAIDPATLSASAVQLALTEADGNREQAWRSLGLRNRYQLRRLMQKFDLK